jgi:hypothetical protein
MEACTIRKRIRNKPVAPIKSFLPIEEVNKFFQVIKEGVVNFEIYKNTTGTLINNN